MQYSGQRTQAKQQEQAAWQQAEIARINAQRQKEASDFDQAQLQQRSVQEVAAAQREAMEEQRKARLVASRALAVAGASGASASDPSVMNLFAGLEGEGAYRAGLALYEGEERARQLRIGADARGYEGQVALESGAMNVNAARMNVNAAQARGRAASASLISGGASLFAKYGQDGWNAMKKDSRLLASDTWMDAGTPSYSSFA